MGGGLVCREGVKAWRNREWIKMKVSFGDTVNLGSMG